MKSWNDLPPEILNIFTTYCGRDCTQVKWMFVNNHWFTFYLSKVYSTIKTSLLLNESVINKILHSSFDIGKYVKHINLSNIQKPPNLNDTDLSNDLLGMIMKRTPNVCEVRFSQNANGVNQNVTNQDWFYFSMILLNTNCWKLQFLPSLGENDMVSASCYYTCAYYSRHTLKKLDVSLGMLSSQDISNLKEFTAVETLKIHKNLISELNDLESLIQFTPKIQELTVRFSANRVFQPTKKEYVTYSRIKKLWLYNFTPKHNLELSTLVKNFPALENLFIFGERDKAWLGNIDDPLTIDNFFYCINSIHKYEIMTPGGTQAIELSKPWLQSIKNSKQDVHLLHTYKEINNPNHIKFESNVVATFYGGSIQSAPLLKWVIMVGQSDQEKIDRLSFLDDQIISCLRVEGVTDLQPYLKLLIAKEQTRLKQIVFFDCVLDGYTPRINAAPVSQHIKCIIFRDCKIDFLTLKSFLKEFESLDYIEFDNCTFSGNTEMKSIDISDTNIKIMKMINFRKMLDGHTYTDTVQNIITISVYFATQNLTRYFSVVENNVLETTRLTYQMFNERFNSNEAVVLNIKVKSMRELSLMLTKTSKVFVLSFD